MKKCPYCAEEIQDEAIVCRYCGRDVRPAQVQATLKATKPQQKSETKYTWRRAFAIVGMATTVVCVVFILIGAFMGISMDGDRPSSIGSTAEAIAPSSTVIPTATPSAITIADIEVNREDMTEVQWDDYSKSLKGVRVNWTGTVSQVKEDGTIYLDLDQKTFTNIYLDGVSQDLWKSLNKGNVIEFVASIKNIATFLGLSVWLDNPTVISIR